MESTEDDRVLSEIEGGDDALRQYIGELEAERDKLKADRDTQTVAFNGAVEQAEKAQELCEEALEQRETSRDDADRFHKLHAYLIKGMLRYDIDEEKWIVTTGEGMDRWNNIWNALDALTDCEVTTDV